MLIGLSGKAGSGKDTVGSLLSKYYEFRCIAQADPMKEFCKQIYGFSDEQLWGPSDFRNAADLRYPREHSMTISGCSCCGARYGDHILRQCYLTPRYALQLLGTEWGRYCYTDTWVLAAIERSKILGGNVAITDVRFENEIERIREADGFLIRVTRVGSGLTGAAGLHSSEAEMDTVPNTAFHYVIENDGDLYELHDRVRELMAFVIGRSKAA